MNYLRKTVVSLSAMLLTASLIFFTLSLSTAYLIRSESTVKKWIEKSGLYDQISEEITEQIKNQGQANLPDSIEPDNPEIQKMMNEVFDKSVVKESVEDLVDAFYVWLGSSDEKLKTNVDLSKTKENLANNFAQYISSRFERLPVCTSAQMGALVYSTNPLTMQCKPQNVGKEQIELIVKGMVMQNLNTIPDDLASIEDTKILDSEHGQKILLIKKLYKIGGWLPYVCLLTTLLSILLLIFLSSNKSKGLKRAGVSILSTSLFLVIFNILIVFAPLFLTKFAGMFNQEVGMAVNIINTIGSDFSRVLWMLISVYIVIAVFMIILSRKLEQNNINNSLNNNINPNDVVKINEVETIKPSSKL